MSDKPSETNQGAPKTESEEVFLEFGRFMVLFEHMVDEARRACIAVLAGGQQQGLVHTALSHQAMTAKPIMDIMRALFVTILNTRKIDDPTHLTETEFATFKGVLAQINKEYDELTNARNKMAHGTWYIPHEKADTDEVLRFVIEKFSTSKSGVIKARELPTNAEELRKLSKRCHVTTTWILLVRGYLRSDDPMISKQFKFNDTTKLWERIAPSPDKSSQASS